MSDEMPAPFRFPELPIVSIDPAPPKLSQSEKYGGLFYLGIAGLAIVVGLVGWFGWSAWSLRAVWSNVYILHDESRSEDDRIRAAFALSQDLRVNGQQRWDIGLRKPLPPLARYVIAESWTTDIVKSDPSLFAAIVAFSEGWPDWLRLLGVRAMAVAAAEGTSYPDKPLESLANHTDPFFKLWVDYIQSVSGDETAIIRLKKAELSNGPTAPIAKELSRAIEAGSFERTKHLGEATRLLRGLDPEAARIWVGWTERDGEPARLWR